MASKEAYSAPVGTSFIYSETILTIEMKLETMRPGLKSTPLPLPQATIATTKKTWHFLFRETEMPSTIHTLKNGKKYKYFRGGCTKMKMKTTRDGKNESFYFGFIH